MQRVRLLVSARAYQPANNIFLSQQTSISRTYQPRNPPANRLIASSMHSNPNPSEVSGLEPGSWIWIFKYLYVRSYHCLDESFFNKKVGRQPVTMALFGLPHIRLVRLVFSVGTVFFSHNNSAGTVFFSQFQPRFRPGSAHQRMAFELEANQTPFLFCGKYFIQTLACLTWIRCSRAQS